MEKYCNAGDLMGTACRALKPVERLVDIGCGIQPYTGVKATTHICCEPYKEYVDILKVRYPQLIPLNMGWEEATKYIPHKSVDTVILVDVIEHLEKEIGMDLLVKTLPLVKQQFAIFTPLGFFEQTHPDGIDAWGLHGGDWQTHRSGWLPEDFPESEGGAWDFYICPDFHKVNNRGEILTPPKGAFWAIWNANV